MLEFSASPEIKGTRRESLSLTLLNCFGFLIFNRRINVSEISAKLVLIRAAFGLQGSHRTGVFGAN